MILKNKVALIYGAGGAIGGAVARAFASEGASVFLTGRKLANTAAIAKDIVQAGRLDISFNAVGIPPGKILGVPLVELDVEQFSVPIASYTKSYFLTARLAARRMIL